MKDLAICVYLDDVQYIIDEFYWLYKSFIYSGNYKTSDIIVFCNPLAINKLDSSVLNDKNIIIVPLNPISKIDPIWKDYPFINSIYCLTTKEAEETLKKYEYTLRTDCDIFITRNLIDYRPCKYTFGMGVQMRTVECRDKLVDVIKKLNLKYCFVHNVGSSIITRTYRVIDFTKSQFSICEYLMKNEFNEIGEWGGWYKGVLTMFAGEIVANQLSNQNVRVNVLDTFSMDDNKISNYFYHIHAWHSEQFFSKHKFKNGEYKDIDVDNIDIDIVNNYCLYIATKSIDFIKKISDYN